MKELTLENVQVDCRELTEEQVKEMVNVFESNGYKQWINPDAFKIIDNYTCLRIVWKNEFYIASELNSKTTITYEKFMELFAPKYEVKHIAESPNEVFNPQTHYSNENGSLYKIANDLGLNHWEFDIFKRLVRCRKKNQFKEDLQKIKDTVDIYLNEYSE